MPSAFTAPARSPQRGTPRHHLTVDDGDGAPAPARTIATQSGTIELRNRRARCDRLTDGELVSQCRDGDQRAWSELVARHTSRLWSIARREGLDAAAAHDAVQAAWSCLCTSLDRIQSVEAVGGWLATAVRREAIRVSKRQRRDAPIPASGPDWSATVDERLLASERFAAVRAAFSELRPSDQRLLAMLFADDEPSYVDIARALGCPIGSIGPTRARALARLARLLDGKV